MEKEVIKMNGKETLITSIIPFSIWNLENQKIKSMKFEKSEIRRLKVREEKFKNFRNANKTWCLNYKHDQPGRTAATISWWRLILSTSLVAGTFAGGGTTWTDSLEEISWTSTSGKKVTVFSASSMRITRTGEENVNWRGDELEI